MNRLTPSKDLIQVEECLGSTRLEEAVRVVLAPM